MRARLRALRQEMDEMRAENDLLRDAHTHRALETEGLRRALKEERAVPDDGFYDDGRWLLDDDEPEAPEPEPMPEVRVAHTRDTRVPRAVPAMLAAGVLLMGTVTAIGLSALRFARPDSPVVVAGSTSEGVVTPLSRPGTVIWSEGIRGVERGQACTVQRQPVDVEGFDCRLVVECGGRVLYGADENTGYMHCGGREWVRDPTAADGDPAVIFDVALDLVTIEDDGWLVRVRI